MRDEVLFYVLALVEKRVFGGGIVFLRDNELILCTIQGLNVVASLVP